MELVNDASLSTDAR